MPGDVYSVDPWDIPKSELYAALVESLKLQSHYAVLLNIYDKGERMEFPTVESWLAQLHKTKWKWRG